MKGLVDVHCHIIPYVDDGAKDMKTAVKMLKMEYEEGVRVIIATPHFRKKMFETTRLEIIKQFLLLHEEAKKIGDGMELFLGCEFHANEEMVKLLHEKKVSTMAGSRYVLTEFKNSAEFEYINEKILSLLAEGYRPIIAHIERVSCFRKDLELVEELVNIGAKVQVNTESIIGDFSTKRFCKKLMKKNLLHFVGTDCHDTKNRPPRMQEAYDYVAKKFGSEYAFQLFVKNPMKIIK